MLSDLHRSTSEDTAVMAEAGPHPPTTDGTTTEEETEKSVCAGDFAAVGLIQTYRKKTEVVVYMAAVSMNFQVTKY